MSASERFERLPERLPAILTDMSAPSVPDYTNDVLAVTAGTRQRPRWTFPERYLPMIITRQRLALPTIPWRPILVVVAILALIAAALYVAGSQRRVPPPFGPARNGSIVYDRDGDIYARDTLDGAERLLVGGPGNDIAPGFTRDGRRITFLRLAGAETPTTPIDIVVADADGSNVVTIASGLISPNWGDISPDSTLAVEHAVDPGLPSTGSDDTRSKLWLFDLRQPGTPRAMDLPLDWETVPSFRGPDGAEIVFRGGKFVLGENRSAVYTVHPDGTGLRALTPITGLGLDAYQQPLLSPDGRLLTYTNWAPPHLQIHIRDLVTGEDRTITGPDLDEGYATFSPDGSRIVFVRYYGERNQVFVMPVAPGSTAIAAGPIYSMVADEYLGSSFSPDGKWVIVNDAASKETRLVDAVTGGVGEVVAGPPRGFSWQRLAP